MILFVVLLSVFTLVLIIEDIRWFEINPGALCLVALNGMFLNILFGLSVIDMLGGAFAWITASVFIRFVYGPNALGQGDIWLMATIGLLAGAGGSFAALGTYGILMIVTHMSYKRARFRAKGKRIISLFPASLPGGLTILLVFCWRVAGLDLSFGMAEEVITGFDITLRGGVVLFGGPLAIVSAVLGVAWMIFDRLSLQSERSV
jgi:hypothetical protein